MLLNLLTPPAFEDEDKRLTAHHLFTVLWTLMAVGWLPVLIALFIPGTLYRWLLVAAAIEATCLFLLVLNRKGHTRPASHLLILLSWAMTTGLALTSGGTASTAIAMYFIVVLIAGLLLSGRAAIVTAALCSLTGLLMVFLEWRGLLPDNQVPHTPLTQWTAATIFMTVIICLQCLASRTIREALKRSRRELDERKRADVALHESEELSDRLIATLPDVVIRMDLTGQVLFVNEVGLGAGGYRSDDLIGRNMLSFVAPADRDRAARNTLLMFERPLGPQEYQLLMKDGSQRLFEVNGDVLRDASGAPYGLVQVCRDITELKRAEKTLQRQNFYLELLNETALGLMRRRDLSDLFQAILSRTMRFSGADEGWIFVHRPEDGTFEYKAIAGQSAFTIGSRIAGSTGISAEVWRTGQTVLIGNYSLWPQRDTAGAYARRRATVAIPFRAEGKLVGILGMAHNDPDRRFEPEEVAILERLAELASIALDNTLLHDRMKQELAERRQAEEENLRLVERLQRSEKMEALGQLAGGVAHDLNNVLGILSGYSELLLLELPGGSRSRDYADKILQSTQKGASIIQDLLTLARRGVTASEVVNLNDVVGSFLKSPVFEKLREYHPRIAFSATCDPNLLKIKGSPVHLEKTLMNLMTNAAESISGKGEVTLLTESRYLDRAIGGYDEVREGEYAVLTVSDTGMGIPPENRERIFEPFYTRKAMGRSGTGLGLTIVWGTVRDHNGYIDVQSEVGRGTTFTLYFPVTREKAAVLPGSEPVKRYVGRGEKVLVVDDIAEQREVASGLIGRLGYSVHAVPGGEEAVAYLKDNRADILVLDMIMTPGMDGLETYQRILGLNPRQRAILVSGFSQTDRVREAQSLGAGAYIKKPYVLETIGMALREELDRPEAGRGQEEEGGRRPWKQPS